MTQKVTPLYEKKVECLFCNDSFQTMRMRSRFIRVKHMDSDFYTEYKDSSLNPYFYEVDVCPTCGFASTEMFTADFPPGTMSVIEEQFRGWRRQDFGRERTVNDAIRTLKLGVLTATLKKEKHLVIAGLCLKLSWLFRMEGKKEQEQRFLKKALIHYKKSYEHSDYFGTTMTDMKMLYLIGELSRRLGHEADAIKYFSSVIQHKNKAFEQKIVEMAREQWYIIRNKEMSTALI
ncbi:DUF2225 domain-containing protein [bacterium LRH843]|nr:DUF2225 domain-containing protein [bacterium LRH843]